MNNEFPCNYFNSGNKDIGNCDWQSRYINNNKSDIQTK